MAVVKAAAEDQVVYREALAALPHVARLTEPAGEKGVIEAVARLKLMWPPKDVPAEQVAARAWWVVYRQALADIPRSALDLAVDDYIKTSEYPVFPIPGKLRALAEPHIRGVARMVARVQMVTKQPAPKPPVSDEERAQVKTAMNELLSDLKVKAASAPDPVMKPRHKRHEMANQIREAADRMDAERQ